MAMKLWSGIVTERLAESRDFYVTHFGCEVLFDSDWFVLLSLGGGELGLLRPDQEGQHPLFRRAIAGGAWVTIDVDDVDAMHERLRTAGVTIALAPRDEPWGERHCVVVDPSGIGVDLVRHGPPPA